jgi:hypothetical protein
VKPGPKPSNSVRSVETAGSLHRFRLPQLLIDYLVEIGVVLGEVACRIPQVPKEVRPDVVTTQAPHVPLWVSLQHGRHTAAHLIDVIDLPGGVVKEAHRRRLHEDVVTVRRAAQESRDAGHVVAGLETEALGEEPARGVFVGRPDHDVSELSWSHRAFAQNPWGAAVGSVGAARSAVRGCRRRGLNEMTHHAHRGPYAGHRLDRRYAFG